MFFDILLACGLLVLLDYWRRWHLTRNIGNIPLLSKFPFVGTLQYAIGVNADNLTDEAAKLFLRFGKTFYGVVQSAVVVATKDHRIVNTILSNPVDVRKNKLYDMLKSWLGKGLLLSTGRQWQTMRKVITPTFHFKILEAFVEVFDIQTDIFIRKLKPLADGKTVVNIFEPLGLLTLDIIAESAMGVKINAQMDSKSEYVKAVKEITGVIIQQFIQPLFTVPLIFKIFAPKLYRTQLRCIRIMHEFTDNIISERKKSLPTISSNTTEGEVVPNNSLENFGIKKRMALLDVLLQSTMDDGKSLTDTQIRDEVNTFMFEGHDTTTSAISFSLYLISRHSEIQEKLFEEIRNHFGEDLQRPVTYADLQQFEYLNCVIKESLRLYPPIPAIGRWLQNDVKLHNCTLPAGSNVVISLFEMMRDPDIYDDPHKFKPERHLDASAKLDAYSNIPFSAGPRNCVGQRFALFEMRTIIIKVLRQYELIPMGEDLRLSSQIILRSRNGVNFGLRPRSYK